MVWLESLLNIHPCTSVGAAKLNRKAEFVEAQIRKLKDYVGRAERDIVREEKRLEELVKEERVVWEGDRRTQERMGTLHRTIELTRHGAMVQQREADNMTREAAGQRLAIASARATGQADSQGASGEAAPG